jgi:Ulp1 family protease
MDGNHWVLAAVIVSKEVIFYYNPLIAQPETPLNSFERKLIESVATGLRSSHPSISRWNIKRHFDQQRDLSSCGVFICWVAYQLATNDKLESLADPASFRKAIYSILRLNCLRRTQFVDATCRVCGKTCEEIKCRRCGQMYHFACVDDCTGFVCPI